MQHTFDSLCSGLPAFVRVSLSLLASCCCRSRCPEHLHTVKGLVLIHLFASQVRPDLKPASMATVEAEFEKQPQRSDWQATRVSRWVGMAAWRLALQPSKALLFLEQCMLQTTTKVQIPPVFASWLPLRLGMAFFGCNQAPTAHSQHRL